MRASVAVFVCCLLVLLPRTFGQSGNKTITDQWPAETLKTLSVEEKVGQLLQLRIYGDYSSTNAPSFVAVCKQIAKYHVGSVDLGARMQGPNLVKATPERVAEITNALQRASTLPLLVGADIERGLASRIAQVPEFPMPMALGASSETALAEREGALTAEEARAIGIHWAYAPVADVNSDPENPIIGTRSFGSDPGQVNRFVQAYIRGGHRGGMLVTVKHFPGEGDTSTDPHTKATSITVNREHLERNELIPFVGAISASVDAVMLAQASVPALDPDASKLATTSRPIVTGLLRQELGFKGLVITDALEMRGLTARYPGEMDPSGRIAIDAVEAGADVLLLPLDLDAAFRALVAAVRSGEIPESRIDESVKRILDAKATLGLNIRRTVDLDHVPAVFHNPEPYRFAQKVSDAGVTLVRSDGKLLPLATDGQAPAPSLKKVVVVTFTDSRQSPLGQRFDQAIKARAAGASVSHLYYDQIGSDASVASLLPLIKNADQVILGVFVTHVVPRELGRGSGVTRAIGFAGTGSRVFGDLLSAAPAKTVVIALGSPYLIEEFPQIKNYICTYSLASTAEESAVKALFGEINNHASLPVDLPGVAKRGTSIPWPKATIAQRNTTP